MRAIADHRSLTAMVKSWYYLKHGNQCRRGCFAIKSSNIYKAIEEVNKLNEQEKSN